MGSSCGKCRDCADRHPFLGRIPIVGKAFRNDVGGTGKKIREMDSYDPYTAKLEQTVEIQQTLTEFRERCEKECDKLEEGVIADSRKYIDEMIEFLETINKQTYAGQRLNIDIQRVRKENLQTEDIIRGYIKKRIQKEVSLDNQECLKILEMESGKEKEKAMTDFLSEQLKTSMSGLIKEIKKSLKKQMENVEDKINVRIDRYTELSEEKMKNLDEFKKIKSSDEHEIENKLVELQYIHALCGKGIDILEVEEI